MDKLSPIRSRIVNRTSHEYFLNGEWYSVKYLHEKLVKEHGCPLNRYTFSGRLMAYLRYGDDRFNTYEKCIAPLIPFNERQCKEKRSRPTKDDEWILFNKLMPVGSLAGTVR